MPFLDHRHGSSPSSKALHLFIFLSTLVHVSCLQFNYASFNQVQGGNFSFFGDSFLNNGALEITPDAVNSQFLLNYRSGRVMYREPFNLWSKTNPSDVVSFSTTFLFQIYPLRAPTGEGLAFILTNNPELPTNSYGQWLGIVNSTTNGSALNHIVAVEFDTRKSYAADVDDNHVGVDVNGINSIQQYPLAQSGVNLSSGSNVLATIEYDGFGKRMTISVSMANDTKQSRSMLLDIDLSQFLLEDVHIGFSASTGDFTQLSVITSWNFISQVRQRVSKKSLSAISLVLATILSLIVFTGCFIWCRRCQFWERRIRRASREIESMIGDSTKGPHKFRLKELKSATANFDPKNKLGQGGFGTVYRGFMKEIDQDVAVKRVSEDSGRRGGGEEDFIAEVTTISRLHHKNLVKLIGWCCERGELLLVYEFLPLGSLDKLIFTNENKTCEEKIVLSWENRHKVICGVASALSYLHEGCEKRVLHRDVKSSNVMLDSQYNAKLGDFGLARIIANEGRTHHSTSAIAGTPGYVAPECFQMGRFSAETDVYAFGVFAMEVACGRRPGHHYNYIVEWVWDLYGRKKVLEAADLLLKGEFDEEQMECVLMVGLACCHPNPNERPSMRVALQVLTGEAILPPLPDERPAFRGNVVSKTVLEEMISNNGGQLTVSIDYFSGR